MKEDERAVAHTTLGVLGNVASILFFLSSVPTIVRIVKSKSNGGISGDLYVLTLFNCMLWCLYGNPYVHPHDVWVVVTNSFGCTFALIYIIVYLCFATAKEKVGLLCKLFVVLSSFITLVLLLVLLSKTRWQRILVVGVLSVIVSSTMHIALLSQCRLAIQSKDGKFLHPNASLAAFLKGAIWTAYGIVNLDVFILIPNGVGVIIGVVQVLLVLCLMRTASASSDRDISCNKDIEQNNSLHENRRYSEDKDALQHATSGITPSSNVSRVSSLIGISRQGSISSSVVVPITVIDAQELALDHPQS